MDANNWRPTAPGGEPVMDTGDWRTQLQPDSRQRIVNKIMETLKRHLPFSGQEGLQELKKIAVRFEEKIYTAATNQSDYLRKISLKMLTMETKSQNTIPTGNGNKPLDPGASHSMPPQVHNQGQSLPISLSSNQPQARQQLSQNMQNSMSSNGVQSSAGLQSAMPSVSSLTQTIANTVGQNANMQSISGVSQNPVGNLMGQGTPSNMFVNSQRQMPGRQQVVPPQQQQLSQNPQQYLYQQQIQQQLLKQKLQQGNHPHSLVQSHIQQQQQQQNLLQPNQLQSGLQTSTVMQPSMMQTVSGLQQNQPSSVQQSTQPMLQQHPQSVLRQQQQPQQSAGIHQQQTPMMQQPLLPPQQQLMGQQSNTTNMSQNQLIGQQNIVGDLQQQQLGQQNNLQNLQQRQLMAQQNNLSSMHQQQLGPQSNVTGLQQQQLLGAQPASLDSTAEIGHANGADWQEEIYQKIKVMKETYLPEINEMYQRIATKLQQHDPLPQQPKSEQLEKLKVLKVMLERMITFLQVSKNNITPNFKEKLGFYEKQIVGFLNPSRYRKPIPNLQQGQPPQPRIQPMQQPQSQVPQLQSHENQLIPQLQSMNTQGSVPQILQTQQLKRLQQRQNLMQNQQMQQQQLHQQAPSPMPGDSDKPVSGISSLLNTGNIVHQPSVAQALAPSLAIGTPGISASPLLAEFTSPDGAHGGALTTVSGKSNVTEQSLECLIKAVKSLSPKALSASVGDIGSVVSMIDRIAGSAAGNGSRAAAGEDLVAMTGCHLLSFLSFLFFTCFSQEGNSRE
ncbi:mediator of RNA polymerase II transcription subunit 15a-like isoform X1 [Populus nigra]|uniref:mediator of RNA polymerase II transcription subunit 15a-like isoform X1 n=2 Tax=Populus nigra TaxID=3691 RepID=UPI002B264AAD|nr:mediator of RNA polymerase II transcription subunit 15a-like isoform X1 [Populus nigra]XP_061981777.1 mediator of RNA polymerase II transcription subunit 15a-like isoform X1 [Populus nigra]